MSCAQNTKEQKKKKRQNVQSYRKCMLRIMLVLKILFKMIFNTYNIF